MVQSWMTKICLHVQGWMLPGQAAEPGVPSIGGLMLFATSCAPCALRTCRAARFRSRERGLQRRFVSVHATRGPEFLDVRVAVIVVWEVCSLLMTLTPNGSLQQEQPLARPHCVTVKPSSVSSHIRHLLKDVSRSTVYAAWSERAEGRSRCVATSHVLCVSRGRGLPLCILQYTVQYCISIPALMLCS